MQWRKEGNKMSLCWMPPWNSHLALMNQIGVALIRQEKQTHAYTHTPVQITRTNWVYVSYVVGCVPKCVIIRKWEKHFFGGLFLTAHAAHVNKKTSASYPAAQSSLHFVSQTFPFVVSFFFFFLLAHVYVITTLFLLTSHVKRMCCTLLHHVARWCSPQEKSRYTQLLTIEKGKKERKKKERKKRSTSFLTCSFRASNVWKQK